MERMPSMVSCVLTIWCMDGALTAASNEQRGCSVASPFSSHLPLTWAAAIQRLGSTRTRTRWTATATCSRFRSTPTAACTSARALCARRAHPPQHSAQAPRGMLRHWHACRACACALCTVCVCMRVSSRAAVTGLGCVDVLSSVVRPAPLTACSSAFSSQELVCHFGGSWRLSWRQACRCTAYLRMTASHQALTQCCKLGFRVRDHGSQGQGLRLRRELAAELEAGVPLFRSAFGTARRLLRALR